MTDRYFRVEHHGPRGPRHLGDLVGGYAHFTALDPFRAHLAPDATGELVLVDAGSGAVVARRSLRPPRQPRRRSFG
jgi:hypothetical protein